MILEETLKEIREILNERQLYAITAYYCDGISQFEISKNLGVSQQAAQKAGLKTIPAIVRDGSETRRAKYNMKTSFCYHQDFYAYSVS